MSIFTTFTPRQILLDDQDRGDEIRETKGREGNAYEVFGRGIDRRRPLGRSRHRWENKIGVKGIERKGVDWIHTAQDWRKMGNSCEHSNKPLGSRICSAFVDYLSNY
jgi:hypothetical protein